MAVGKNKKLGRKKGRKKVVDPFTKKDWYDNENDIPRLISFLFEKPK